MYTCRCCRPVNATDVRSAFEQVDSAAEPADVDRYIQWLFAATDKPHKPPTSKQPSTSSGKQAKAGPQLMTSSVDADVLLSRLHGCNMRRRHQSERRQ